MMYCSWIGASTWHPKKKTLYLIKGDTGIKDHMYETELINWFTIKL